MTMKKSKKVWSLLLVLSLVIGMAAGGVQSQAYSVPSNMKWWTKDRFGMFIHFNMPTYVDEDWPDPDASPELFNPVKLDCRQWARAAKSAGMTYGCLTTKHHSGFCIWDTKTTDYSVMSSPFKRDVVKEYVDAFRAENLDVMLYYSILDTHAHLRPGWIVPEHKDMVKNQLRELLTNYGKISAIIIDGWDAPWSRISYDQIPFEEIYTLIKSIQPDCLVMDLNSAKYPADALFYTDIKSYEQGAGQHIDKESNALPALSCLPIQKTWFWKSYFPQTPVKDAEMLVKDNIVPMGKAYCNFILNVAPNRDGLMDDNALKALTQIGKIWAKTEPGAAGVRPRKRLTRIMWRRICVFRSARPRLSRRIWPRGAARTAVGVTIWRFPSSRWTTISSLLGSRMRWARSARICGCISIKSCCSI